jgi:predicted nuclease of predicted toxin-antitoxin system
VKLLFDQNLSHRLVKAFADEFPGSAHVRHVGLEMAPDGPVWDYAKENGFVIVSKDSDFHQRSFLYGHPPKVVWIRRGNCSTATIDSILREHQDDLVKFAQSEQGSFLALL